MLLVSFLLLSILGSALAANPHNVGYFAGRSGDIIVQPENAIHDNSALLLHGKQFDSADLKTLDDVRVADLFAHVMGTQPFNVLASRVGFPQGDLFNKPKATLLMTLDSIDPVLFAKYSTWKDNTHVDLTTATYPANPRAMLSNIATGAHPSVHGIVGDSWVHPNGEKVSAHAASEGVSLAANMADILTQEWAGASLTVSASSSGSMASAFAVNQQFTSDNAFALSMDNGAFGPIYDQSTSPLSLNKEALQAIFNDAVFSAFLGAKITNNDNKLTITVRSSTATFDLNSKADFTFLAELGFVYNLLNKLEIDTKLSPLVADSVPDFYSFVFSGLKEIRAQYGEQSDAFVAALNLVDATIQQVVTKFDNLYGGRAVSAVACLNTNTVVSDELKGRIYDTVRNYYNNEEDFSLHFPSLYIKGNAGQACSQLKSALGGSAEVHCFASSYNWMDGLLASSSDDGNTTNPIPINTANVSTFWILFFLTLGIFSAVIVGVVSLVAAGEDAAKDSLLFRSAGRAHAH